jgi:hypothetical protein
VTSFVTYRVRDLGMQYPGVRHIHVKRKNKQPLFVVTYYPDIDV